ncbi:serine hydroxymethyltransferase [Kitasatospora aburaviensis]
MRADADRISSTVNLAAFENVLSRTAERMLHSPLANRYLIGHERERRGMDPLLRSGLLSAAYPGVDRLEQAAAETAQRLLGAAWVDFRPLSGLHATMSVFALLTEPGGTVWSIAPENGGHFATGPLLESMGRRSACLPWSRENGTVDLAAFAALWRQNPGAMVFLDHGVPLAPLPLRELRAVVGPGTLLVYDASHTLGLVAGGEFQDPIGEGCDIVQGNTHKSFPGAHKGLVAFADAAAGRDFSDRLGTSLISSQQTGPTLANYVTTLEMGVHAAGYARDMLANRAALARALGESGFTVYRPPGREQESASHVLLVEAPERPGRAGGYELAGALMRAGLMLNARPVEGRIVLRLGVQEVTRRGMGPAEMWRLADLMARASAGGAARETAEEVAVLAGSFSSVAYGFDDADAMEVAR